MSDRPAILRGTPVRAGKSWPAWPQWDESERGALGEVLESGVWSSPVGPEATGLAAEFSAYMGARHGLALTNGTHTLEAALAACDVGEGDEVIVPALTFIATATSVLAVNGTPVIVDVDPDSLCIDVAAAEAAVTERTRAIIPVHLAGTACDMDALTDLCNRRNLVLIEDCAHAHGTRWQGRGVGSVGSFGSFSFQANKLMTAGEGGALITNDKALRDKAWSYVNCGRAGEHWYHHTGYGSNLRMTEWQAAVLRAQLRRYPEQLRTREERARLLDAELERIPGLRPQRGDPRMDSRARYAYVFHYDPAQFAGLSAEGFEAALTHEGIPLCGKYKSITDFKLFREANFGPRLRASAPKIDYSALSFPHAEHGATSTIWLDHRVLLAEPDDVLDVVRAIERIQAHAKAVSVRTIKPVMLGSKAMRAARRRLAGRAPSGSR